MKKFYERIGGAGRRACGTMIMFIAAALLFHPSESLAGDQTLPRKNVVDVAFRNATLESVLVFIMKETGYTTIFSSDAVHNVKGITLIRRNATIDEIMTHSLRGTNLHYSIEDGTIVVKQKSSSADPPTRVTVRGRITSKATKAPIAGAIVTVKGTNTGTTCNAGGDYSIRFEARQGLILQYSFLGMETVEVIYAGQESINVELAGKAESIEEVVVTGFSTVKKSGFTGTAVAVSGAELRQVSSRNILDALQVFDPSLRVMKDNLMGSDPNTIPDYYIRGQSGIGVKELDSEDLSEAALKNNPNAPLFILDGFEVTSSKVYDLDPNRIKNITILKDAAATAIYGSRAANGVMVIDTYPPEPGQLKVTYNLTTSFSFPDLSDYNLMNAAEKLQAEVDAGIYESYANLTSSTTKTLLALQQDYTSRESEVLRGVDVDWLAIPLRNAFTHKHNLTLEGGNESMVYAANFIYDNQAGVMKGSSREKFDIGLTAEYRWRGFNLRNETSFAKVDAVNSPYGSFSDYTKLLPYASPIDDEGEYLKRWTYGNTVTNPLYVVYRTNSYDKEDYYEIANNTQLNWDFQNGLILRGQFAVSYQDSNTDVFADPTHPDYTTVNSYDVTAYADAKGELWLTRTTLLKWNAKFFGNYSKSFDNVHFVNAALGIEASESKKEYSSSHYRGFPGGQQHTSYDAQYIVSKPTFSDNHTRLFGAFLSANYTYRNIYLFDGSLRFDGSSEFGSKKRIAPFWSFGTGLNIHKWINRSKLTPLG